MALSRGAQDFTDRERDLLARARPFLIQAYRTAVRYSEALAARNGRSAVPRIEDVIGARFARDARSAREARGARDARGGRHARGAQDARGARDARHARGARQRPRGPKFEARPAALGS